MKKLTIIAIIAILTCSVSITNAQVKVNGGFKLGSDFSNIKMTYDGDSYNDEIDSKRLISPRLGFFVDVEFFEGIFVQTGVFGASKGFRYDSKRMIGGKEYSSKEYQLLMGIDIPLNFGYKFDLGAVKIFGMVGPQLTYNMYSTLLYKADDEYDNDKQTIGTKEFIDTFKPMNFAVNIEGGVELDRFQFSLFYTQGLSNLSNISDTEFKTNVFGVTAAVLFGRVD